MRETTAVIALTTTKASLSVRSRHLSKCPAPHMKMKSANKITRMKILVGIRDRRGYCHNETRIWTGMLKYAMVMMRSETFMVRFKRYCVCSKNHGRIQSIRLMTRQIQTCHVSPIRTGGQQIYLGAGKDKRCDRPIISYEEVRISFASSLV